MMEPNESDTRELVMNAISGWLNRYVEIPGFKAWKNRSINATIMNGFELTTCSIDPFPHSEAVLSEHAVITAYLNLVTALQDIAEMEYYFRRYPFNGLPVSKGNHLRHTCEAFFSKLYIFEERMTLTLNEIDRVITPKKIDIGSVRKAFQKTFKTDLRERHNTHHHFHYRDIEVDQISMIDTLSIAPSVDAAAMARLEQFAYRRATRNWVLRVKSRTKAASHFVDAVGRAMLTHCDFLDQSDKEPNE
jgi:hypothetical protein